LGCGTYIFSPKIFESIENTVESEKTKQVELTDVINKIAIENNSVYPFNLNGEYFNINTIEDLNSANFFIKSLNVDNYITSLIIPTYNEELTIG